MLPYDPVPWLMAQEGVAALRARRRLGLERDGDDRAVSVLEHSYQRAQLADGSFSHSPMKTAGVLNLLDDLRATDGSCPQANAGELIQRGAAFLLAVLEAQPGYERARGLKPGALTEACDLCGFFGPHDRRLDPEVLAGNAQEMNYYREYEPLLGPKSPVRGVRRGRLDRPGPSSCYTWGLVPLAYTVEALCRAGHGRDPRLQPAIRALLGAQRDSGGWCRNLAGHPSCTVHVLRALGSHPVLGRSKHAERALDFLRSRGAHHFAEIEAAAACDLPAARYLIRAGLAALAPQQRRDGTFGTHRPRVERVVAVLVAERAQVAQQPRALRDRP